ncbi:hypothetical protein P3G55_05695 [Leptospira sp. 96542]|nr:hypothetical protein [Leptospira sp. 96542]
MNNNLKIILFNKNQFLSRILLLFFIYFFLKCQPASLNNPSDPNSKAFFENAMLLCALGVTPCNSCSAAPGPWDSFIGEVTTAASFTNGLSFRSDLSHQLYGLTFTNNNFGSGGINFQGTVGSTTNFLLTKFSATGQRQWLSYLGQRSDRPNGVRLKENDGVYVFGSTPTNSLPKPILPHVGVGANSFLVKYDFNQEVVWSKYYNDGTNTESVVISDVTEASDATGFYIFGYSTGALLNPGIVIGASSASDWFIQKINLNGEAIWTRYFPSPTPISNFRPLRIQEIPNAQGYYLVLKVDDTINGVYTNGLNIYPTVSTNLIMKLDQNFAYQWHRYLGGTSAISDDIAPSLVVFSDQTVVTSSLYSDPSPSIGLPHPGGSIASTIFYRLDGSGNLVYSSFVYKTGESVMISDTQKLTNGNLLISGTVDSLTGIASELNPMTFLENYRVSGKESFKSASVQHCDGSFSSYGSSDRVIADSPIPYGNGATNAIFSRFKL